MSRGAADFSWCANGDPEESSDNEEKDDLPGEAEQNGEKMAEGNEDDEPDEPDDDLQTAATLPATGKESKKSIADKKKKQNREEKTIAYRLEKAKHKKVASSQFRTQVCGSRTLVRELIKVGRESSFSESIRNNPSFYRRISNEPMTIKTEFLKHVWTKSGDLLPMNHQICGVVPTSEEMTPASR